MLIGTLAVAGWMGAAPAFAQGRRGMGAHTRPVRPEKPQRQPKQPKNAPEHFAPLEQFKNMTPEQRERELEKLPPDRREKLQRQLQTYDNLSPAQREQVDWFTHLPPERQNSVRKAFKSFQNSSPERQQAMREELTRLRAMPEADRNARISSPEFRQQYRNNEQQILAGMAGALPSKP